MKYTPGDTKRMWFTADYHLFHKNIIKYDDRPFPSTEEMAETIIRNHNRHVREGDIVFNLGNFSLGSVSETEDVLRRLNGQHCLIKGNHESTVLDSKRLREMFVSVLDYAEIVVNNGNKYPHTICLFHYPIHEWNVAHHGAWMLHGHTHGHDNYDSRFKIANVGIMLSGYFPISYAQLERFMETKENREHHVNY